MSNINPLTIKRFEKQLSDMIVYFMAHDDMSLLEAYVNVAGLVTSDAVIERAKAKINFINKGQA